MIRRRGYREPEMADFIQFINDETLIVTDPVFSKEAVEQYVEKKPSYKKGKISAFATGNRRTQMYAFTAMKDTSWDAVIVLWTRP